ncbi:hypothetical protein [Novipirellula aureliae]|nr:hypothetical protein [Novipirellula aureliae]
MHRNVFRFAIALALLAVIGCGKSPIAATLDSRTKTAFGIDEWIILDDYDRGLSLEAVTGDHVTTILTFGKGQIVRAVYLQHDTLSDRLIFKIDASDNGYYGADLDGVIHPNPLSIHKHPKMKGDGWVLASGKAGSESVDLVLRFAENSRAKLSLASE